MSFTSQYMQAFLQFSIAIMLILTLYATDKHLKRSMEETEILKEQVSLLLQQITTE